MGASDVNGKTSLI